MILSSSGMSLKSMSKLRFLFLYVNLQVFLCAVAVGSDSAYSKQPESLHGVFRIVFYNVENLYDAINDPGTDDDPFTLSGERRWNEFRLRNKLNNLSKAIMAAGEWEIPAIIGLCEVENRNVLELLIMNAGLGKAGYRIVHRNSADSRGIDAAVLYKPEDFLLLDTAFIKIRFPFDTLSVTRDIVYLKGVAGKGDTLHVFVNHWPSRWGGQAETAPYRHYLATVLRSVTDSLFLSDTLAKIIIMGDFNDEPYDNSIKTGLRSGLDYDDPFPGKLYNISCDLKSSSQGSYKYQGEWFLFDQFIVSGSLLKGEGGLQTSARSVRIINDSFLLIPDERWFGYKPFRTYEGFRHTGGFSDHLPVVLDLWW